MYAFVIGRGRSVWRRHARRAESASGVRIEADGYVPWDQRIEPEEDLSVSYALTQPDWSTVEDRRSQTYTVKAVISIAGNDRTLEQDVEVAMPTSQPQSMPP